MQAKKTGDASGHHVPLARGQRVVTATELGNLVALRSSGAIAIDGTPKGVEEILLAKRLGQELDRAGFHRANRHGNVAVTREKDDRQRCVRVGKLSLEIEPALPREAHVEDEATRSIPSGRTEERLSRREHFDGHPDRREESAEGVADGSVVVDDEDNGCLGAHRIPGNARWNVAPWSGFDVAQSRPR